jgi:uncharacterized protein (DUF1501 family)
VPAMTTTRKSRREFIRQLAGTVCAGGATAFLPQLGMLGSALAQVPSGSVPGYRALVCIYFAGGNDSWNMLMPGDQARHGIYLASRGGIYNAASNAAGLGIPRPGQTGGALAITDAATSLAYGIHPSMPELKTIYDANRLAFLANVGTLRRPITKTEYNANAALRPPQLYSHNDQENQWQFGRAGNAPMGWGGQVADRVRGPNLYQALSPCISIAGSNRFQVGDTTFPYQMGTGGVANLSGVCNPGSGCSGFNSQRTAALELLLDQTYGDALTAEYARTFKRGRELQDIVKSSLDGPSGNIATAFPNEGLANQLRMVARMIRVSRETSLGIQHARQIYYVRVGGFDLHDGLMSNLNNGHAAVLDRVSAAVGAFWTALGEIGAQNEVTTFSMSEFARTLNSNGNGSDHAWGGVQFALGGAVQGGRLYGSWPDQTLNGPVSFSRGQTIPAISVEQMGATLARWMGVTNSADLNAIFPNLPNFPTSDLGFLS